MSLLFYRREIEVPMVCVGEIAQGRPGSAGAAGTPGWYLLMGMDSGTMTCGALGLVWVGDTQA